MAKSKYNPYEEIHRASKAGRLTETLYRMPLTLDEVRLMNDREWDMVAKVAGVKLPSKITQSLVIAILEGRARTVR